MRMREGKISNVVALAVTLLAVVTAVSFSLSTVAYYREVVALRQANAQHLVTIQRYKSTLENIQKQLAGVGVRAGE